MTPDLDALDALATAATPGPWAARGTAVGSATVSPIAETGYPTEAAKADAAYIAALDPATVRRLIARVREGDRLLADAEHALEPVGPRCVGLARTALAAALRTPEPVKP